MSSESIADYIKLIADKYKKDEVNPEFVESFSLTLMKELFRKYKALDKEPNEETIMFAIKSGLDKEIEKQFKEPNGL